MRTLRLGTLAFLLLAPAEAKEPALMRLTQTIALPGVEGRIDHLSIDEAGQRLFAAAIGNNTVEIIDLKAGKRAHSLTGLSEPQGVAYVPESDKLFVSNGGDGSLKVFDGHTLEQVAKLDFKDDADNLRYDAPTGRVFVGSGNGAIGIVDARALKRVGEINLPGHPEAFELEKNGERIFVNVPTTRKIEVVDGKRNAVVGNWPVNDAQANFPMAIDENHHRLFVGCRKPAELIVFDTQSGKGIGRWAIDGDADDIFYGASRKEVYVVCGAGFIDIFRQMDADHYNSIGKIPTATGARTGLFVPNENRFYLAVPHRGKEPAEIRVYDVSD